MKKNSIPDHSQENISNMPELVTFLLDDFKDTSEHLRTTDKKVEFLFQVIGGTVALITSVLVTLAAAILGNGSPVVNLPWFSQFFLLYVMPPMLIIVALLALWLFAFLLKGTTAKQVYLNRLNFLRQKIYLSLGVTEINSPAFLYAGKLLPKADIKRVGMADMFLVLIGGILVFLWIPIYHLPLLYWQTDFSTIWSKIYEVGFFVTLALVFWGLKRSWQKAVQDTEKKIEEFWKIRQ